MFEYKDSATLSIEQPFSVVFLQKALNFAWTKHRHVLFNIVKQQVR